VLPASNNFQTKLNNRDVDLFILHNSKQTTVAITNYGATIVSIVIQDKDHTPVPVVAGFNSLQQYIDAAQSYYGCTIGRYANRIAGGKFMLDGNEYNLPVNNTLNTLHGGPNGFHTKVWEVKAVNSSSLTLQYISPDGEEGFPGELHTTVTFTLNNNNELMIEYSAVSNKNTVVSFTNHAYFNLNGVGSGTIHNHQLQIEADAYTPVNSNLIPTGELDTVRNTPFNFLTPVTIGSRINENNEQLQFGNGYDHNYALKQASSPIHKAATVTGDQTGIMLTIFTTEPGLQFYTGNFMNSKHIFTGGFPANPQTAFCLETQQFPNSPNQHHFPSPVVKAGEQYTSTTIYQFS
jgi:aldose 1-epimerase